MDADAKKMMALKEELRRDLEAIERVERLMAAKSAALGRDERQAVLPIGSLEHVIITNEDDDHIPATSLKGTIEEAINAHPDERWTNQRMLQYLRGIQFPLLAKKPVYSIGQAMQKLSDAGRIKLVRKGAGNQPNIYKAKKQQPEAESHSDGDKGAQADPIVVQ